MAFIAPTVTVTVGLDQRIVVISQATLGSNGTSAGALTLGICHATNGAAPLLAPGSSVNGLRIPADTRVTFPIMALITGRAPGTYTVGLCGQAANAAWSSNAGGSTYAIVF